jgi:hypothetical protein
MTREDEAGTGRADDYEYDLAHEAEAAAGAGKPGPPTPQQAPPAMHVTDDGGDYNYDAAHDRA